MKWNKNKYQDACSVYSTEYHKLFAWLQFLLLPEFCCANDSRVSYDWCVSEDPVCYFNVIYH